MKRILILRSRTNKQGRFLIDEINSRKNLKAQENLFSDLKFKLDKGKFSILAGKEPVENFNLVFIKTVGNHREFFSILIEYLKKYKVLLVDDVLWSGNYYETYKFSQMEKLGLSALPYPKTFVGFDLTSCKQFFNLKTNFRLIAKDSLLDRGEGVFLIKSEEKLAQYLNRGYLIQNFLKEKKDLRILVIGDEVIGAIQRIPQKGQFKANIALGGRAINYHLTEELKQLALKATKVMGFDIAGVDILIDENDNIFILEVNRTPNFQGFMKVTGIDVNKKIVDFLEKKLKF